MNNLSNKGMYLETILTNAFNKINTNRSGYFFKVPLNIKIVDFENRTVTGNLNNNFNCDFIGCMNGYYFEIEAKETKRNYISKNILKENQKNKLKLVNDIDGIALVIIHFTNDEKIFIIEYSRLDSLFIENSKIPIEWFEENLSEIVMNGINLDIEEYLNHLSLR